MNSWSRIMEMQFEAHLCATIVMKWWETNILKGEKKLVREEKNIANIRATNYSDQKAN
jgi:hypothetical protein